MRVEIKVPAMGESISEATIGVFLKSSGSEVNLDDELVELETDKVNQLLYAPAGGVLNWTASKDEVVKIGQVIGYIETDQKASPQSTPPLASPEKPIPVKSVPEKTKAPPVPKETPQSSPPPPSISPTPPKQSLLKSEGARISREVFIREIPKENGKSTEKTKEMKTDTSNREEVARRSPDAARPETRKKMSKIRKVIATRLVDVLQQTAMLTTFNEVDMTAIIALRNAYKDTFAEQHKVKLGFMSFFVKAAVSALEAFPEVNAYLDGDDIVFREYYDIGIAVGTEKGLIVPVLRGCDHLTFAHIEQEIEEYAKKARAGKLAMSDLQGGGFTITNGGVYGSLLSTPILNPPQCAILGMHKIMKRPVVVNDEICIRQMMYLALSYDHRLIDGKEAVSFLVHMKNCLEDPSRIFLEV